MCKAKQADFTLAPATVGLYKALCAKVAMLEEDRPLTPDSRAVIEVLRGYKD